MKKNYSYGRVLFGILFLIQLIIFQSRAQENIPVNGVRDVRNTSFCFQNAILHIQPGTTVENGTLIIKNGRVVYSGEKKASPKAGVEIDLNGSHVFPSFIEPYSDYGMPKAENKRDSDRGPQLAGKRKGPNNWNDAIRADVQAFRLFNYDQKASKEYLSSGFGILNCSENDGIARGTSVLISLDPRGTNDAILKDEASEGYSFNKGSSKQSYPNSLLGSVAIIRQTWLDAEWYDQNKDNIPYDGSLEAINRNQKLPKVFLSGSNWNSTRASRIGNEFGHSFLFIGNGDEYQIVDHLDKKASYALSISHPQTPDLTDPVVARNVDLEELMHWELASSNAKILYEKGFNILFTGNGLKKRSEFLGNLRRAIEAGLPENEALNALTKRPAKIFGVEKEVGDLQKGKRASFFISDKNVFTEKSKILDHYVNGQRVILNRPQASTAGKYKLSFEATEYTLLLGAKGGNDVGIKKNDTVKVEGKGTFSEQELSFQITEENKVSRFQAWKTENGFQGNYHSPDGELKLLSISYLGPLESKERKKKEETKPLDTESIPFPFGPYGMSGAYPSKEEVLIKNALVWTNTEKGNEEMDVWVKDGKIYKLGKGLQGASGIETIDAKGKHLTSGIIDEHSHIALSSVNDGGQNSSAEVRMLDAIYPENIHLYRQLSGGVTAAQLLHGSANPVGGQSAIIKFRWGKGVDDLLIRDAPGFIKFALGENVKQSNWGDLQTVRFPQTRMGVEQVYDDLFQRAVEYDEVWKKYKGLSSKSRRTASKPRRDLELETIAEIKNSKRFITCHSYVQSEINMLMKIAEKYGFRINTFTHILEGYKVADIMREHGAGGSTFSDWWAYKFEVKDAIPHNAAIMTKVGVVSAINSDDSEMARRLNQEAAKSVKYGGISQEEAWKMVTLNPAKLLHLDHRMGMVKEGYDADLVLWDQNPLSIYSRVERTYVDGVELYSKEIDDKNREWIKAERNRLVQKALLEKKNNPKGSFKKPLKNKERVIHCETEGNFDF